MSFFMVRSLNLDKRTFRSFLAVRRLRIRFSRSGTSARDGSTKTPQNERRRGGRMPSRLARTSSRNAQELSRTQIRNSRIAKQRTRRTLSRVAWGWLDIPFRTHSVRLGLRSSSWRKVRRMRWATRMTNMVMTMTATSFC